MKRKCVSIWWQIRYLCIGIKDAFRLYHIRLIFILGLATVGLFWEAWIGREDNFGCGFFLSCATGLITGIVLFVVSQVKLSQGYKLSQQQKDLKVILHKFEEVIEGNLAPYIQHSYPRTDSIDTLTECPENKIAKIIEEIEKVMDWDYEKFLLLVNYSGREKREIVSRIKRIDESIPNTKNLLKISFKKGDANGICSGLCSLRAIIDDFSDLYTYVCLLENKYGQLQYLINSKFV